MPELVAGQRYCVPSATVSIPGKLTLNASTSAMQSLLLLLEKFTLFLETGNSVTRLQ